MKVKKVMTTHLAYTTPEMQIGKVAELMANNKVGAIPVVDEHENCKIVGIITDRDITTRVVALGKDPKDMTVKEVMSSPVVTVKKGDSIKDAARRMEKNKVRRLPVVNKSGEICGIVSQADLARKTSKQTVGEVVQSISKPTKKGSSV